MNLGKKILNNVFKNKNVISVSIVGSYTESKNLDKTKLTSPDYVFGADTNSRFKYKKNFEEKNLAVYWS